MDVKKHLLQVLLLASLVTVLGSAYEATAERLTFADTAHNIVIVFYVAITSALIAGVALFLGETPMRGREHREVPVASDEKGEKIFAAILTALGPVGGAWVYIRMANAPSNLTESAAFDYQMWTLLGGGLSAVMLIIGFMRLYPRLTKVDAGWMLGALVGGFVGYLMRPSLPLVGQLPFEIVITAGTQLKGLDTFLVGAARESCLILVVGVVLGAVAGTIIGPILLKLSEAVSNTAPTAPPADEHARTCPFCAETIKAAAKVCRFCGGELQAGATELRNPHFVAPRKEFRGAVTKFGTWVAGVSPRYEGTLKLRQGGPSAWSRRSEPERLAQLESKNKQLRASRRSTMRRLGEIAGTIAVLALLASCSKQTELTRDKARSVLTGAIPSVSKFPLAQSQVKTGQKDGMWRLVDRLGIGMLQCQLTPKGQALFKGCWQGTANLQGSLSGHAVEVLNPIPTSIKEITGITAGGEPGLKQVEFTYKLDIPENLKRYIRPETRAGVALLKLYDDGWRVANFEGKGVIATEDVVVAEPTPDSRVTEALQNFCGIWEYDDHGSKMYVQIRRESSRVKLVPGYKDKDAFVWTEPTVRDADGIYLDLSGGELKGEFVSNNFQATHGAESVYSITLSHTSNNTLLYSVHSSLTDATEKRELSLTSPLKAEHPIVGTWKIVGYDGRLLLFDEEETVTVKTPEGADTGHYKVLDKEHLRLEYRGKGGKMEVEVFEFLIAGDKLTLKDATGNPNEYERTR